ncbi:DUF2771 family protein [uncultured Corynebacterium sp.]|uniref:DUF2771 family protein n=1 Tax=uncultured Corynebacterium sp. TaxID=159447 RepID=UPI0025E75D49|nr:DUF2771 family protein [uncultured Corynebacterium sp.]
MASKGNKKAWRIIGVIAVVALFITALVLILDRSNDGTVDDPHALTVKVRLGDEETEVTPYRVCDLFAEGDDACTTDESAAAEMAIGEEEVAEVEVPAEVSSVRWTLQRFYADESVNAADTREPGESRVEKVAGSASVNGERTPLGVIEVSTTVVGLDDAGEETTYGITWSVANEAD